MNVRFLIFIKVATKCVSHILAFLSLVRPDCAKPVGDGGNWHGLAVYETPISEPPPPPRAVQTLVDNDENIMFKYSHGVALASTFDI